MLFDSHAHYDDPKFDPDRDTLLSSMNKNGIELIVNPGSDLKSSKASVALAKKYDFIYAAVGVHPHDAKSMNGETISELALLAREKKVVAIGEIGLDYYYDNSPRETQKYWLIQQLKLAKRLRLPVIIHDRDAHGDCMDILRREKPEKCVLHSFSGSVEMAEEAVHLGMMLSISGPLTYKNNHKTVEVVKRIPLEFLMIETDSPYLPPEPHRGERNSSLNVKYVAQKIADLKGISFEEVSQQTNLNARNFFSIR